MNDRLLKTIEILYDSIGDSFDHGRGLEAYSKTVDDTGLILSEIGPGGRGFKSFNFHNIPEDSVAVMTTKYDNEESSSLFQVMSKFPVGMPILRRVFVPDEVHFATPMYKETSEPWGIHSDGAAIISRDQMTTMLCGFVRFPGQAELDHEQLGMMAVLNSHYDRAMRLQGRLDKLEQTMIQSSNLLDLIDFGIVLYGRRGTPVFVNEAARRITAQNDGVVLDARKLSFLDARVDQAFQDMVSALYRRDVPLSAKTGGTLKVPRVSGGQAYGAVVVPLPAHKNVIGGSASAAVFLFDPTANRTAAITMFVSSYDLSRAEAELAHRLALGDTLEEAATRRGISRNTAKGLLRSIFAKTNTNRQSELVSLLLRSVAGINLRDGQSGQAKQEKRK